MITFDELGDGFTLHTLTEVAALLGVSRYRVEDFVRAGTLAAVHHGGRWMVATEEVERFTQTWTPRPRGPRSRASRRFRPPSRPADLPDAG